MCSILGNIILIHILIVLIRNVNVEQNADDRTEDALFRTTDDTLSLLSTVHCVSKPCVGCAVFVSSRLGTEPVGCLVPSP